MLHSSHSFVHSRLPLTFSSPSSTHPFYLSFSPQTSNAAENTHHTRNDDDDDDTDNNKLNNSCRNSTSSATATTLSKA